MIHSTEQLDLVHSGIDTPDVELCVANSTFSAVRCVGTYNNWTSIDIPNCWERFFRTGDNGVVQCYVFESNGSFPMTAGLEFDNRPLFRRLDFYWHIDSLENVSFVSVTTAVVTLELYHPKYSPWRNILVGDNEVEVIAFFY